MGNVWGSIRRTAAVSQLVQAAEDDPWRHFILPVHVLGVTALVVVYQVGMQRMGALRCEYEVLLAEAATLRAEAGEFSDRLRADAARLGRRLPRDIELRLEALQVVPNPVDFDGYERIIRSVYVWSTVYLLVSAVFYYFLLG